MESHALGMDGSYGFKSVLTHDSDEHAAMLASWEQTYNQLSAGSFHGALQQIWLNRIHLFRERTNRSLAQDGLPSKGHFVFGVPLAMSGTALFGNQIVVPDSIFVFRATDGFSLRTPEFFDVIGIVVPERDIFAAMGSRFAGAAEALPGSPMVFMPSQLALSEFRGWLNSLFAPDGFQAMRLVEPMFRHSLRQTVVDQLASLLSDAVRAPLRSPSFPGRCRVVEQAVAFALSCGAEPVSVGDLCAKAKVSRRLLNYCFQDVLNTNPVHYLKVVRLNGVRRELRRAEPGPGVIRDIAGRWGFWHFSRFACEYRSLFGELPSETLSANRIHPT